MSDPQELLYDKPFILHIKFPLSDGNKMFLIEEWLLENDFQYDSERQLNNFYHTYVLCANLIDGAKIETFIQTLKNG